ncbi:hypothetical protein GLOTRDRAFT_44816 [Gloeophyllum trabeum ATCC 11539]|uniref:Aminoglycoside phosphotransferase domain-containing protein n=1 Tax=Gloeophyllum trabeum (strain ATCC 11539 / FP-39264 / Madison 617) TaxID=670483 RepID=S7RM34_GLOTA|nr:uncharacterized protein GLOTRDRAFT_44816 [Gloeophyllum trabeum ATCC 11539]EPQ53774.1 hypothetical protein GLOTRDRAFT_44816 [Gloeophyllum trabeum ATCC 11539]
MEEGCIMITHEKKYYIRCETFVKRNLVSNEYLTNFKGETVVPRLVMERLKNEVAALRYVRENTNIPVPAVRCAFEVAMARLSEEQKQVVMPELEEYVESLHKITSRQMGGIGGVTCLPYRVDAALKPHASVQFERADTPEFVLCHNALSQHNVLVNEKTLKITGIIDWEYAGFYPPEFEGKFYKRPSPSAALEGEVDDVPMLLGLVDEVAEEIVPGAPHGHIYSVY